MFIGHFAVALAAKRAAPRTSLGMLYAAAQLPDLLWPTLVLLGLERVRVAPGDTAFSPLQFTSYPYSHSLVAVIAAGLGLAALYLALRRDVVGALVVAFAAVSHWVLDFVSHRPDLQLTPGSPQRAGLGLWNSVPATVVVEVGLLAIGLALFLRLTRARDRIGTWGLAALVGFMLMVYAANIVGSPPPSAAAVAWGGEAVWLLVAWAWWVDRHRRPR